MLRVCSLAPAAVLPLPNQRPPSLLRAQQSWTLLVSAWHAQSAIDQKGMARCAYAKAEGISWQAIMRKLLNLYNLMLDTNMNNTLVMFPQHIKTSIQK